MDEKQQKDHFQHQLPFYTNGNLGEAELNWMEEYLAKHPSAAADVQLERILKSAMQEKLPDFTPDTGLAAFMERIQAGRQQPQKHQGSFANLFSGLFAEPRWSLAMLTILAQTGVIAALLTNQTTHIPTDTAEWRSPAPAQQQTSSLLRITFKPPASEEQIRLLLVKIRGNFICGPGQLGNYIVKVPGNTLKDAQVQVKNSEVVESVEGIQVLPDDCV